MRLKTFRLYRGPEVAGSADCEGEPVNGSVSTSRASSLWDISSAWSSDDSYPLRYSGSRPMSSQSHAHVDGSLRSVQNSFVASEKALNAILALALYSTSSESIYLSTSDVCFDIYPEGRVKEICRNRWEKTYVLWSEPYLLFGHFPKT